MILEIYNLLKSDGFDVKIGDGIIISKNGFNYYMRVDIFIKMCKKLSECSLVENNISMNDTKGTYKNS